MRRTAAALATAILAAVVLTGPMATIGQAGPSSSVRCPGATTSACELLDQLAAQLAPLQPVLALAGPVVAQLAPAVQGLAARADQPGGVPTAVVADQAQALLGQLDALPAPVRDLLPAAQLDGLTTTLEALVAELTEPVVGGQKAEESSQPTPAATGGSSASPAPASSTAASPSSFGGSLSGDDSSGARRGSSSPAIPDVPVGDTLTFAPLALPDFGFSPTVGLGPSAEIASSTAADAAVDDAQLALDAAMAGLPGSRGTEIGVVVVLSLLLLGAAFAAQAHKNAHTIPD